MPHNIITAAEAADERRQRSRSERPAVVAARQSLIDELEAAILQRNIASRAEILRRVTDLFAAGSASFGGEQNSLFDDVMGRLVNEIDHSARVAFGERIAAMSNTPLRVTRDLALDDSIDIAGPVLRRSDSLDEDTLIKGAKTKGQDHLFAISQRSRLSENVTDVLVERGDQKVVISTAANAGARFSEFGYTKLVSRSKNDSELALLVWARPEIPREYLLTLFESASEAVQRRFESADRSKAALVHEMIKQAADQLQTSLRDHSSDFATAMALVEQLNQAGELTEQRLYGFAERGRFDETTAALSLLTELPVGAIERALVHDSGDQLLVLAKSINLSWKTARAILAVRSGAGGEFPEYLERFNKLRPETARAAIQFYRLRERASRQQRK
jgi:uncharacterized protein (DUF2336 family)